MKKIVLICSITLLMTACTDKNNYEAAVLAQMQTDKDIQDYDIDPEDMTKCVVDTSSKNMPGLFPLDPDRMIAYQHYTKMLEMSSAKDKKKAFKDLHDTFGSPKELADAHSNYTQSTMECINIFVQRSVE